MHLKVARFEDKIIANKINTYNYNIELTTRIYIFLNN